MKRRVDTVDQGVTNYLKDLEGYTSWCQEKLVSSLFVNLNSGNLIRF